MSLREWQHHIGQTHVDRKRKPWCGADEDGWQFVDIDHAVLTVQQGQRIQPCPACVDAILGIIATVDRDT